MTYAALAGCFLLPPLLVLALAVHRRRPGASWWIATSATILGLLVLTTVFDNLTNAPDPSRSAPSPPPRVPIGPMRLEDLAWPIAAGLLLPALHLLLAPAEDS